MLYDELETIEKTEFENYPDEPNIRNMVCEMINRYVKARKELQERKIYDQRTTFDN